MAKFDYDDALLLMHNLQNCQQVILQMKGSIFFCISNSSRDWVCSTL
jgi:hypothetical protein